MTPIESREHPVASAPPRPRRLRRAANAALCLLAASIALLHAFPGILFRHTTTFGNVTVHAVEPIPAEMDAVLEKVRRRHAASAVADRDARYHVFLCDGTWRFPLLAPTSRRSFAVTNLFGNVVVARHEIARDRAFADRPEHGERSLSGVLAHEFTHADLRRTFGVVAHHFLLPEWKIEGCCDYVAGESSMARGEGVARLTAGRADASLAYRYFTFRLMVEQLLEREGLTVHELMRREFDPAAVLTRAVAALASLPIK